MAFTIAGCIAATKTELEAVSNPGMIHDYRRMIRNEEEANAILFHAATSTLRGGFISTLGVPAVDRQFGSPVAVGALMTWRIRVELFLGVEDATASEKTFRDYIERVVHRFNHKGRIYVETSHQGPFTANIQYIMLADSFLMHYADCLFELRGRTSP